MKPIPESTVRQTWERIALAPERNAEKLTTRFGVEQPAIVGYLLNIDRDVLNRQERQVLFYLGMVVWQIMTSGQTQPQIEARAVEQADNANAVMLEGMMGTGDSNLTGAVEELLRTHNQAAVLQYTVSALVQAADEQEVQQDNIGVMLIDIKTVVDCFDQPVSTAGA